MLLYGTEAPTVILFVGVIACNLKTAVAARRCVARSYETPKIYER